MSRKQSGERILGPYPNGAKWRVIQVDAAGNRESVVFDTESKAERYVEILRTNLIREEHTTETALTAYKTYLTEKGNKESSIDVTELGDSTVLSDRAAARASLRDAVREALRGAANATQPEDEQAVRG
jgi:hypothetical protein